MNFLQQAFNLLNFSLRGIAWSIRGNILGPKKGKFSFADLLLAKAKSILAISATSHE